MKRRYTIEQLEKQGEELDKEYAMNILIEEYIRQCGFSYGFRYVLYDAIEGLWMTFSETDSVYSEAAQGCASMFFWWRFNKKFNTSKYQEWEPCGGIGSDQWKEILRQMVRENFDSNPDLCKAICYGIKVVKDCIQAHAHLEISNSNCHHIIEYGHEIFGYADEKEYKSIDIYLPEKVTLPAPEAKDYWDSKTYEKVLREWICSHPDKIDCFEEYTSNQSNNRRG